MSSSNLPNDTILRVEHVSKRFSRSLKTSMIYGVKDIVGELTATRQSSNSLRKQEFWAVDSVSFDLGRGRALGLVGANGSGKTTLLRVISGLVKPDAGSVTIRGRVVPLIALGAGFNQILTGRENIYVNLAILGLTRREIDEVYDSVAEFSEISDALDAPVQTYSSGMAARLGFSCAVHAKADILLIDEVLSVGDMRFRSKCYRKLAELRMAGVSFILVSHNTNAILSMCDEAIYLRKGVALLSGEPYEVMSRFEEDMTSQPALERSGVFHRIDADESQELYIKQLELRQHGVRVEGFTTGENAEFSVRINCNKPQGDVTLSLLIRELSGESETILHLRSDNEGETFFIDSGSQEIGVEMPLCGLTPGLYTAKIYVHKRPFYMLDAIESFVFRVIADKSFKQCIYYQPVIWKMGVV
jgi:lipopolysaccharide transport system ATP-binding protein